MTFSNCVTAFLSCCICSNSLYILAISTLLLNFLWKESRLMQKASKISTNLTGVTGGGGQNCSVSDMTVEVITAPNQCLYRQRRCLSTAEAGNRSGPQP